MSIFEKAKWIWIDKEGGVDEYGEFTALFAAAAEKGEKTVCRISVDGDYTLFINGEFVSSNQYGDFEHYKIYDELDISPYVREGENEICILVWHIGRNFQRYVSAGAGLIFELEQNGGIILASSRNILCRKSAAYESGRAKIITPQMGFGFAYDATKEGQGEYRPSFEVDKKCTFYPRPIKKLSVLECKEIHIVKNEGNYYLIDMGEETVGLPTLDFFSDTEQKVVVCWGEDLKDDHVRRILGISDFSFEYNCKKGHNAYTNHMLRISGRYLELYAEKNIELNYLGVIKQVYDVAEKENTLTDELDRRIYDLCVRTLKLSMMEHYVDTPWREQCLYVFDSRNQMLCGYKAFDKGNSNYARSNLKLVSEDRRDDRLLAICYPCGDDLTIPSFSLYYFMAIREYLEHTGDLSLANEVYDKLLSVLGAFLDNRKNGLICRFEGCNHWNFYDWTEHMEGHLRCSDESVPDLMINCLFITALENLRVIAGLIGRKFEYGELIKEIREKTKKTFYNCEKDAYSMTVGGDDFTVLGNCFAILSGVCDDGRELVERIARGEFIDCTLSMRCFKYDTMLKADAERWQGWIRDEIRRDYKKMLDAGATSVWETIDGAEAFGGWGSLCHGWSAVPILYL
jgi:hypothetical protein